MDRDDALRARGDLLLDLVWIDAYRVAGHVNEDRGGMAIPDGIGRGDVRHRRHEHLVARLHAETDEREVQRRGPVVGCNRVLDVAEARELLFERRDVLAYRRDPSCIDAIENVLAFARPEMRLGDRDPFHRRGHRCPICSTGVAGTPTASVPSASGFTTTALAPTVPPAPMRTPGMTLQPIPRKVPRPTITLPARPHWGATWTATPMWQSVSIVARVFTMARSAITDSALTTAPAMIATPFPIRALDEMTACGLIALTRSKPSRRTVSLSRARTALEPTATNAREYPSRRRRSRWTSPSRTGTPRQVPLLSATQKSTRSPISRRSSMTT